MEAKLWGVPLVVWGGISAIMTIIWTVVWPDDKLTVTGGPRFLILRWGHALVWLLLSLAAFVSAFNLFGGAALGKRLAQLSLGVYLVFMFTNITSE